MSTKKPKKRYKQESGIGVIELIKASFLFDKGLVQFESDLIKIQETNSKEIFVYQNKGNLFPDALNANEILRQHF